MLMETTCVVTELLHPSFLAISTKSSLEFILFSPWTDRFTAFYWKCLNSRFDMIYFDTMVFYKTWNQWQYLAKISMTRPVFSLTFFPWEMHKIKKILMNNSKVLSSKVICLNIQTGILPDSKEITNDLCHDDDTHERVLSSSQLLCCPSVEGGKGTCSSFRLRRFIQFRPQWRTIRQSRDVSKHYRAG